MNLSGLMYLGNSKYLRLDRACFPHPLYAYTWKSEVGDSFTYLTDIFEYLLYVRRCSKFDPIGIVKSHNDSHNKNNNSQANFSEFSIIFLSRCIYSRGQNTSSTF